MAAGLGPRLLSLSLSLSLCGAGVWAQLRLVEAGGGLRAPGDSVLLTCRGSGFTFRDYTVWWYRQSPGGSLEWVSLISSDSSVTQFAQSVEGRATASRDNSRSLSSLSLRALSPCDSARYFCAIGTETGNAAELKEKPAGAQPSLHYQAITGTPLDCSSDKGSHHGTTQKDLSFPQELFSLHC